MVLLLTLVARLAGQEHRTDREWVKLQRDFFVDVFQVKRGRLPPCDDVSPGVGNAALAADLDTLTREYLLSRPEPGARALLALDGKTLRGVRAEDQARALHLFAAYLPPAGVVLMNWKWPGTRMKSRWPRTS